MIILERQLDTTLPIDVEGILPDRLLGMRSSEIAALPIGLGRDPIELGEAFRVRAEGGNELALRWSGSLANVHWIGAGLTRGQMELESSCGRHVGSQMSGGTILVRGDVGDFAGAEMRGGLLRIEGHAANHLGAGYPGSSAGMNRGEILVGGNAGRRVGELMRRGLIAVAGKVDQLCGWNMLAGTIVVGSNCAEHCGNGMRRGTIFQVSTNTRALAPTFIPGGVYRNGVASLISVRLRALRFDGGIELPDRLQRRFIMYHGDQLRGGRGEVLLAQEN